MKSPEILLHLGLPKTATSSLQHNVLQKLHEEDRVNFLGKCIDYEYKTGKVEVLNYTGKFIRDAAEGTLGINEARQQLAYVLKKDALNIFSDEGLMVAYPGKGNKSLSHKFKNLAKLFEGYSTKVVVTLRDPVEYLYSLYVQLYPDFFSKVKELNSIEKYVDKLLANRDDVLFESFFFEQWLPVLKNEFSVTVLQYEQLMDKDLLIYQSWAQLLGLPTDEFRQYFDLAKVNVKDASGGGVQKFHDFKGIENKFRELFSKNRSVFVAVKWMYNLSGLKVAFGYRFASRHTHHYPEGDQYESLRNILRPKQRL